MGGVEGLEALELCSNKVGQPAFQRNPDTPVSGKVSHVGCSTFPNNNAGDWFHLQHKLYPQQGHSLLHSYC